MFDHVGIVVKDLKASGVLYKNALDAIGVKLLEDNSGADGGGWLVFGTGTPRAPFFVIAGSRPSFWTDAHTPAAAPAHLAFRASAREEVDRFHAAGIASGARSNGAPGPRGQTYYAAYLLDLDGNNIEAGLHL
ncbi:MAG: VOC family protein [Rhodospirillaceae bacterium]